MCSSGFVRAAPVTLAWWWASASLAFAQDLLQEPSLPGSTPWLPAHCLALGYLLLFLFARAYLIACPSRALAWAQLEGLWAEYVEGWEDLDKRRMNLDQEKRDTREDIKECLQKVRDLLEGRGFWGRIEALLSLLLWNGKREMAAWALMHRAERRAAALMSEEEVRARLVRGLGELGVFPEEEKALWQKQLKRALGMEGGDPQQGSPSKGETPRQEVPARAPSPSTDLQEPGQGSVQAGPNPPCCQKGDPRVQRALLGEFLAALYDARDTSYARLLTLHNKAFWLLLVGLGLAWALWAFGPQALVSGLDLGTSLLLGFLGGLLSRLLRVVATDRLPTDYGAYWVPLFLAPVLGALGAVGGYLVFWALVEAKALGEGLRLLLTPPAAYGLLVALGFSERLLKGLTDKLEGRVLEKEAKELKGDQKEDSPQVPGRQDRR